MESKLTSKRTKNGTLPRYLYVGTYTAPNTAPGASNPATGVGIAVYRFSETGLLEYVEEAITENPSSLAINASGRVLYAVNELGMTDDGMPQGAVTAFAIAPETGGLTRLNQQSTQGAWPCHCSLHPSGDFLMAANYGTGDFPVFPVTSDGSLGSATGIAKSSGRGPDPARQTGPHAHMILTDPKGRRIYGVDLGTDRVLSWTLDDEAGQLSAASLPFVQIANGSGPRHMVFFHDGLNAFVLNELSSSVDVFDVEPDNGSFVWRQSISTLPASSALRRPEFNPADPGFIPPGTNTGAEIRLHPNGKWLYATNRGMNSVTQFEIDPESRALTPVSWTGSQGECPRGMILDPEGQFLIVGNQNTNNIVVFEIDQRSGELGDPIQNLEAPTPVDFVFGPAL